MKCPLSVAVIQTDSSPLSTLEWKADTRPVRMSVLTDTGRSEALKLPKFDGSYRPRAVAGVLAVPINCLPLTLSGAQAAAQWML